MSMPAIGLEHLGCEMRRCAGAGRRVVQFAGIGFDQRNELLEVCRRHRRMHHQHQRDRGELADRREILDRIERQLLHPRIDRKRDGGDEKRVAVRRGFGDGCRADHAAAAGAVVDDRGSRPGVGEALRDHPRDDVGRAAGHERDDQLDLLARIGSGPRLASRELPASTRAVTSIDSRVWCALDQRIDRPPEMLRQSR